MYTPSTSGEIQRLTDLLCLVTVDWIDMIGQLLLEGGVKQTANSINTSMIHWKTFSLLHVLASLVAQWLWQPLRRRPRLRPPGRRLPHCVFPSLTAAAFSLLSTSRALHLQPCKTFILRAVWFNEWPHSGVLRIICSECIALWPHATAYTTVYNMTYYQRIRVWCNIQQYEVDTDL